MSATNYMSELPFAHLDEDSFQTLTYELEHGLINYNFENLVNLSFNPFANTVNQNFALTSGLDRVPIFIQQILTGVIITLKTNLIDC